MKFNIFLVCFFLLFIKTMHKMNFERNIFVYWQSPIEQAPLTVKTSYEKLKYATQRDGWRLHLLTGSNIKDYLPDYDRFQQIVSKGHRRTVHEKSDILRIYLIEQHGGVWMDFSSVLFQNLDWLSDDKLFDQLIINKVGTNVDDPDMLMIGEGWHQSPYSYYNADNRLVCEEYFGTAIHFIAAKRKSRIMTAWKEKYDHLVTQSYKEMMPEIIKKRYYLKNIYQDGVYLSGNIAFEQVIQQRQKLLDDNIGLFDIFSRRQNVYEHLKIWQVHGEVGPIAITRHDRIHIVDLFRKTKEEVENRTGKLWFYVKINGYWRWQIQTRQQHAQQYFRNRPGQTVQKILKAGPTNEQCKLFYIVNGSILHMLYQNSKYKNQIKTPIISIAQRQMFRRYCSDQNPEMYKDYQYPQWAVGQVTKPQRQIQYANMTSFWQKISIIPIVYLRQLDLARQRWEEAYVAIIFYLTYRNLFVLAKIVLIFLRKTIMNRKQQPIMQLLPLKSLMNPKLLKEKIFQYLTINTFLKVLSWLGFSFLGIALLFAKGLAYTANYQFFQQFDWNGNLGKWTQLCVIISFNVILDWMIGKFISHRYVNTFVSMETILKETRMMLYLPLGYVAVLHMYILFGFAHHHTMNFVAGGLLLYTWLEEIKERKIGFDILNKFVSLLSNTKWIFLCLFLVYRLNRNIRYFRYNYHYVKESLVNILNEGFWVMLYVLTAILLAYFIYKLFFIECSKWEGQTEIEKTKRFMNRANIYHCLIMLLIIWLVISKTSEIYDSKMESIFYFNFLAIFKILLGLYILCASLIRLSLSTQMFTLYGLLLGCLSFAPIMYWYYGQEFKSWLDWRPHLKKQFQTLIIIVFIIVELFRAPMPKDLDKKQKYSMMAYEEMDSLAYQEEQRETKIIEQ